MLRLTGDARLRERVQRFVAELVKLQDADGYLGPYPRAHRLTGRAPNVAGDATWDAWGHYHIMLGLLMWHDETADAAALDCAKKIGELLCERFLGDEKHVAQIGSPDQNQAVIHGLALLYRATGTRKYLDLAEEIVEEFALPGAGDYLRTALAGMEFYATPKPRWESLHAILGLAELHRINGKDDYRRAFEHIWWSIVKLDRHNNGGFSSGEQAVGNPYDPRPIETCCTIAWLAMSVEMLRTTGNSVVADELELSTLNSIIGAHSPDGTWSTYNTPMDGRRIPSTQDISFQIRPGSKELNCCSVNAARGFGMISDWALMIEPASATNAEALVLNWFGPSRFETQIGGARIGLVQETEYPADGRIILGVAPERPAKFPLKLRIPHWSRNTKVAINGDAVPATAGTYCVLDRDWRAGDRVTITLDMRLRAWSGERECAGKVSLFRGPLLLAYESAEADKQRPGRWQNFGSLFASQEKGAVFEHDFEGDGIKWFGRLFDDAGKARVLIDGKEVALVDQYGPVREQPFTWQRTGLGPGKHTIRIEVSGDRNSASRGTWSNVVGFGKPGSEEPDGAGALPPLNLSSAETTLVTSSADAANPILLLDVTDAAGQTIRLRDFATAGQRGRTYRSWLPARSVKAAAFSMENPLRTSIVGEDAGP